MSKNKFNDLILPVCNIALKAGSRIEFFYKLDNKILTKKDNSPLTKADLESNKIITDELINLDKEIPILSEEKIIEWNKRRFWKKYWLIDPLDGTKEFINKNDEFTVNIALIEDNKPMLGIIYVPVLGIIYFAAKDYGSYKLKTKKNIDDLSLAKKIFTKEKKITDNIKIMGSRSHSSKNFQEWINNNLTNYEIIKKGSSIKFCEIAEGNADIYPRLGPTSEWDIAAGHIILEEAGGNLKDLDNKKILYNKKENIINPSFIASCKLQI